MYLPRRMAQQSRGAVVVTGASTGIGETCAMHLASIGFRVFAGVRKPEDAERMRAAGHEPLTMDVTDEQTIRSAAAQLGDEPLAGLVNNAGVAVAGPLEFIPVAEFRRQLDVNVVGQVAVTQAFLPALRKARGRIVNMGSIGGRVALPLLSPYNASKFAMEGITDSLRRELRPWGIHVAIVEPGAIATPIWEKSRAANEELAAGAPPEAEQLYGKLIERIRAESARAAVEGLPPIKVAEAVAHALTAARPKTRYLVGGEAKGRARAAAVLPDRAFDALVARTLGV
jgi:NAD(P)-dependent dehydrogenase (short-subunit alcohol dehydrogenase family)